MGFLSYVLGPKLYQEYGLDKRLYEPGGLERFGDQILSTLSLMWNISYYTSPLIVTFLYRRGYLVADSISSFVKFTTSIGIIVVISLCIRGFGRSQSRSYVKMIKAIELSKLANSDAEAQRAIRKFDFDFRSWQVDFDANSVQGDGKKKPLVSVSSRDTRQFRFATLPCKLAAYVAIHTFGIRMIYPGYVKILQYYMHAFLVEGRSKLVEEHNAVRYKVKTSDCNEIDSIFVDNRQNGNANGDILVVCSEGNAAYYEVGIMGTPLALKYSVLGWNHPGFAGSSGAPYPDQDRNAIDAILQLAIHRLGFGVENIILYGWSIGGVSALWASNLYPDVKGVILDATFDDVLYLAQSRMPESLAGIVKLGIREYCNLNNVESIQNYNGPILLIRRTEDEIISEDNRIETNRGNYLALTLLKYRYPLIFKTSQLARIKKILSRPLETKNAPLTNDDLCMSRLITYASDQGKSFPMLIGEDYTEETRDQMAEFLLRKHFRDYKSTHCTPLPRDYFDIPWDIPIESGFVFT
ncbi:phosphatidylserine lipase ABHD16A [Anastrepha obliqua]|uniref:phosphatidylserine lipase ABHD16A n=1 Tax=Anastrepha obliqua TaxID=95512 RepID=UPI002409E8ED|nr:phosphatidylserine lipase ABHD16A [Anastrepha obliqua]